MLVLLKSSQCNAREMSSNQGCCEVHESHWCPTARSVMQKSDTSWPFVRTVVPVFLVVHVCRTVDRIVDLIALGLATTAYLHCVEL